MPLPPDSKPLSIPLVDTRVRDRVDRTELDEVTRYVS